MKLSSELLRLWTFLETNFTSTAPAVDCFGVPCYPWSQEAVAWDSTGVLEKEYYDPIANKYHKHYNIVIKALRECMYHQRNIPDDLEYESDIHVIWWGAILTALADEGSHRRRI